MKKSVWPVLKNSTDKPVTEVAVMGRILLQVSHFQRVALNVLCSSHGALNQNSVSTTQSNIVEKQSYRLIDPVDIEHEASYQFH